MLHADSADSHTHLERVKINTYALVYIWKPATNTSSSLLPLMLAAHIDVVPVDAATLSQWTYPPYSGHLDSDRVWGRGASYIASPNQED